MAVKKKAQQYSMIRITLVRSLIGRTDKQMAVVRGLGLHKMHSHVVREKRPEILGMIRKVDFMLKVEEIANDQSK
jgi:large subunit ribosomal protein L30